MTALDIGAGLGKCMRSLENAGFDVFGLEASLPFYERAISKMNISPDKLKRAMVEDAEFSEGSFDFITFGAVFEHLYHPAAVLEKVFTWLKPNGLVHIEVPSSDYTITKIMNAYFRLIGTNYVSHISPLHPPFHLYEFSLKSFEELGRRLNFKIDHHYFEVCEIVHIPRFLHPMFKKYMKMRNTGMELMVYLKKDTNE